MSPSSSLILNKIIDRQVVLQLVQFWLAMSKEDETELVTEETLHKLANGEHEVNFNQQLAIESFYLLISTNFVAWLRLEKTTNPQKYQVIITFDPTIIVQQSLELGELKQWETSLIKYLKTDFVARLGFSRDKHTEFIAKAVKLLLDDKDKLANNYKIYPNPPMEKLLHYQVEQEQIIDRIKIQISQNLNLSQIIQTALDHSRDFLELDRLAVYQFDVTLDSDIFKPEKLDTVTYEAKTDEVTSTLYFKEETCWQKLPQCKDKYHQGFSLVVDNVEKSSHLHPCLQTLMHKFDVKAKVVTPINVRGKLWGLIVAHQCFESRQWHYQDVQFLRQIAEYLAIAIYQSQSYQQLQQQKRLLEKQVQAQAQQIKDALIAAEAASKSKHEFLGSMSHELRTPLTCVIGLSSTLLQWSSSNARMPLPPEKQQKYLHLIQQSGKHLLTLINNILEFSDVESGKHLLNIEQISLSAIAKESIQLLEETAKEKEVILDSEINVEVGQNYFFADEDRLKEILYNLLNNAIKFTPEHGKVALRVWREKRRVVFQIEDTGIGIAPEEIPLLFEKFKQIENYRQRTHGGTGLGLALSKKLIELHGGTIEVESALGEGSVFTVYLPLKIPFQPRLEGYDQS